MPVTVDYYFSPVSPFTYLGHARFASIAAKHGAAVRVKPMDLGQIFPNSGGLPLPKRAPQRQAYRLVELKRWSAFLDLPLNPQPKHFPVPDAAAARLIVAADAAGADAMGLTGAILRAVWAEERDVSDPATLAAIAGEQGLDAAALTAAADAPEIEQRRQALTQEAVDRQVFGAPTYGIGDELFWGQDRLDFVDRALAAVG
ncbi:MAG: 2-hydroxychromene-2-carboxylate isomerase [Inquilinus sp.]|nr:2-hydroxychromene-2-carboxylate isomerase [Inquilinus sp.]